MSWKLHSGDKKTQPKHCCEATHCSGCSTVKERGSFLCWGSVRSWRRWTRTLQIQSWTTSLPRWASCNFLALSRDSPFSPAWTWFIGFTWFTSFSSWFNLVTYFNVSLAFTDSPVLLVSPEFPPVSPDSQGQLPHLTWKMLRLTPTARVQSTLTSLERLWTECNIFYLFFIATSSIHTFRSFHFLRGRTQMNMRPVCHILAPKKVR